MPSWSALGVGVVGAGSWGVKLARAFARARGVELIAICDLDAERLAHLGAAVRAVTLTTELEELLADPAIQAVAVAVDSPRHHAVAKRALLAGRHVLVEKPMALSVADGADLVALAKQRQLVLMAGHVMLHHPGVLLARDLISGGDLGQPLYLHATRIGFGTVRTAETAWWSVAPHDIAAALFLFDAVPTTVSAAGACYLQSSRHDVAFATLTFADGRVGHIHVSWLAPVKHRALTIVGSRKMLTFDEQDLGAPLKVYDRAFVPASTPTGFIGQTGAVEAPPLPLVEPLLAECEHFADCIRAGGRVRGDGDSALAVLRVLEAGDRSMRSAGAPVPLDVG